MLRIEDGRVLLDLTDLSLRSRGVLLELASRLVFHESEPGGLESSSATLEEMAQWALDDAERSDARAAQEVVDALLTQMQAALDQLAQRVAALEHKP